MNSDLFENVAPLDNAMRSVNEKHAGIFKDPDRLWNLDEYAVRTYTGESLKVISGVDNHHGLTLR